MKTYLVNYSTGWGNSTCIVETGDDYVPASDMMQKLAKLVVKKDHPKYMRAYAAPDNCGGSVSTTETSSYIKPEELHILAVSRLDV